MYEKIKQKRQQIANLQLNGIQSNASDEEIKNKIKETGKIPEIIDNAEILKLEADIEKLTNKLIVLQEQREDTFNPDEMDEGFMKKIDAIKTTIKGVSSEYSKLSKVSKQANIDIQKSSSKVGFAKYDTGAILNYINNYNPKDKSSSGTKDFLMRDSNKEMRTKSKYNKYVGYFKK